MDLDYDFPNSALLLTGLFFGYIIQTNTTTGDLNE